MLRTRAAIVIEGLVGLALLVAAFIYFTTPASSLPGFFPGHDPAVAAVHTKHAIGAALLGIGALILAWFSSGPASAR